MIKTGKCFVCRNDMKINEIINMYNNLAIRKWNNVQFIDIHHLFPELIFKQKFELFQCLNCNFLFYF